MSQLLEESEALRPQAAEDQTIVAAEAIEPLDLSFVEELRREPSGRDRKIQAAIDGERREPADVAAEFELAEGTVRKIVQRVRRWKGETHDLVEMSSLDMLLAYYDQLKWQSRQLRLAWEYSAATREFVDKTVSARPAKDDPARKHERVQVRRVASRGPNERYMRLHDHILEKMLQTGREVQELKAQERVVAGSPDPAHVVAGSPDPHVVAGSPDPRVVAGSPDPHVVAGSPDPHVVAGSPDPATARPWSPTTAHPSPACEGPRSETAAGTCCGQETAAEQAQETAAQQPRPADVFAEMKAHLDQAAADVRKMQQNPSPLGTVNVQYTQVGNGQWQVKALKPPKGKPRLSQREKHLLKRAKHLRQAEPRPGDTIGHSQQHVIPAPQAAMPPKVTSPQVE